MAGTPQFKQWWLWLTLILLSARVAQAEIAWRGPPFFLVTRGMAVKDILHDFGANYSVPVIVSPEVDDLFVGKLQQQSPEELLCRLARLFNLSWYYDGEALYIYKSHQVATELLAPKYLAAEQIATYLEQSEFINGGGCRVKLVEDFSSLEVFGVPACRKRIGTLVRDLDARAQTRAENQQEVMVFPLRYASAADLTYRYRQQEVVVPGVVTLLREIAKNQPMGSQGATTADSISGSGTARFSADQRRNAVVIHDRSVSMPMYSRLIQELDRQAEQIEISVAIMDVNVSELASLGVQWSAERHFAGGRGTFKIDANNPAPSGVALTDLASDSGAHKGYLSAVLSNPGKFMVKIEALQENCKAKVLSQPSVVTLNNVQAVLDKSVTFFTKVHGKSSGKLESVVSGTLLRVTPRIVDKEESELLLQINIQDGAPRSSAAGATGGSSALNNSTPPAIENSEITTQASLRSGQSLLLGGFIQDKDEVSEQKVPLLGDLPLLGVLFRSSKHEVHSVVRLFLIKATPLSPV
jgi:type III secretion protein C